MSDFRQCVRCGGNDVIPGTALDAPHKCPHGVKCEIVPGHGHRCQNCADERLDKAAADLKAMALASLHGAREAFLRPGCGVIGPEAGIANGPAGVVRSK